MYRLISESQYTRLIIGGYQPDEYADFWRNRPELDIEAVKSVAKWAFTTTLAPDIYSKSQAILKQLEGV